MKKRTIPFGYQCENGVLTAHPQESRTVRAVFAAYLSGEPLSKIAAHLTAKLVEYLPGRWQWDKARVKRILDNSKYMGEGDFPQIITHKEFQMAHRKKEGASTNRQPVDEDIKLFKGLTHCHHCGGLMVRRMDSRMEHPVTWKCPQCGYFLPLPDEEFKQRVFLLQKKLADKPLLAEKEKDEIPVTSMEARRLTNEIFRKLDSGNFSEDELVNLALQCAAKNYEAITSARHITDRLTATLLHAGPLSAFDRELFQRTVSEIHLTRKGEILLKLQNGVFVGEGEAP
ncbi:MAG TPA: recombinase family protein [Candidatus Acutalibacter ornithocaccae]|uniref:Recombinase family protein n=1 Tax=Candidatus Acutalibacter ornithocaccae TaxID=2838416 RepID=A0A9D2LYT1_9FIRM|nr:recombinase family protein [Candidatus Acutalibacter ornithocaccae]